MRSPIDSISMAGFGKICSFLKDARSMTLGAYRLWRYNCHN
jgi:hypothetical protein